MNYDDINGSRTRLHSSHHAFPLLHHLTQTPYLKTQVMVSLQSDTSLKDSPPQQRYFQPFKIEFKPVFELHNKLFIYII
ncbi:hypothetical protein V6Z11_A11G264300 [Gossypium hirsutum]